MSAIVWRDSDVFDFFVPNLKLDPADAADFRRDLAEVVEGYAQKNGGGDYLLHIGFTPMTNATQI